MGELLERVQKAARYGDIITTKHGRARMSERGVSAEDVKRAILTATSAQEQREEQGDIRIRLEGGRDIDGGSLTVVVAEDQRGLRLVSVMGQ